MNAVTLVSKRLHDGWTLTHVGGAAPESIADRTVPAEVPGTTHTDLLRAGLIEDPYVGMNERDVAWMWGCQWRYSTSFAATSVTEGERVDLVFDGLDTVATVRLNEAEVARTKNMHRQYRLDVRALLEVGNNALDVEFESALEYARGMESQMEPRPRAYEHPFNAVRKMACSFGWDWGPNLQTAGIWKSVRLERWRVARLADVRPLVTVKDGAGVAEVHLEVERARDAALTAYVNVAGQEVAGEIPPGETEAVVKVTVDNPQLWWPAGYGEPHLYDLTVDLHSEDEHVDHYATRVGFRSVELDTSRDDAGAGFTFVVNGQRIFVKGANWIPDDHLLTRVTKDRLRRRITQAREAHMNLLRVWGGGIYESDDFYDLCDEMGVLVWQDFPFACAAYAEEAPLLGEVVAEARDNVTRLAPHPSLVIYNGSNENLWGYRDWGWQNELGDASWGLGYYEDVLPKVLHELDPTRPYIPSSPFSPHHDHTERHPNDPAWGPVHEWNVWNRVDYTAYRDVVPRFAAEFGFQGPATWATLARSLPVDELTQDHPAWLLHQKAEDGNGKLNRGLEPHLPTQYPSFEHWHWATQLNQARAVRFGIEHYRSHWPYCAGAIVWQLNDCWPVTSWSAIDGDERKKPLWYGLKAAYEPRLLTFQPRRPDGGHDPEGAVHLVAVNDTDQPWDETLTFTRMGLDGTEQAVATAHLSAAPREAVTLAVPAHVAQAGSRGEEVLVADAGYPGDADHVRALWTFAEDKDIAYERAPYTASAAEVAGGYEVTVTATGLVRDLTVLADKVAPEAEADTALVTLVAGETHVFRIRTKARAGVEDFLSETVLVSANSLVA